MIIHRRKKCSVILLLTCRVEVEFFPLVFLTLFRYFDLSFFSCKVYLCFPLQHAHLVELSPRQSFGGDEICAAIPQSGCRCPRDEEEEHNRSTTVGTVRCLLALFFSNSLFLDGHRPRPVARPLPRRALLLGPGGSSTGLLRLLRRRHRRRARREAPGRPPRQGRGRGVTPARPPGPLRT